MSADKHQFAIKNISEWVYPVIFLCVFQCIFLIGFVIIPDSKLATKFFFSNFAYTAITLFPLVATVVIAMKKAGSNTNSNTFKSTSVVAGISCSFIGLTLLSFAFSISGAGIPSAAFQNYGNEISGPIRAIISPFLWGLFGTVVAIVMTNRVKKHSANHDMLFFLVALAIISTFQLKTSMNYLFSNPTYFKEIGYLNSDNPEDCLKIPPDRNGNQTQLQDTCWYNKIIKNKDISLCSRVKLGFHFMTYSDCEDAVYEISDDASDCEKSSTEWQKDRCYFKHAKKTKDSSLCEKMSKNASFGACP